MPKAKTYKFYSDAGHGWLAVKRKELEELNLLHLISPHSYQRGETVYLEEDDDVSRFFQKLNEMNIVRGTHYEIKESYAERSPIRSYKPFSKETT